MRQDLFLLSYGGLHFGFDEMMAWTRDTRTWFVETLLRQREAEQKKLNAGTHTKRP